MRFSSKTSRLLTALSLALTGALAVVAPAAATVQPPKIALNRSTQTVTTGVLAANDARLDAPIICPNLANPCDVTLDFSASMPAGLNIPNAGVLHWNNTEWSQVRNFTVSLAQSNTFTPGQVIALTATAVSSSVYYSGFAVTLTVTINPPAQNSSGSSATPSPSRASLASTGMDASPMFLVSFLVVAAGALVLTASRSVRRSLRRRD